MMPQRVPYPVDVADRDPIRIAVVDDDDDVLTMMRLRLQNDARFVHAGEARDGKEALALAIAEKPDAILLDLSMPQVGGLDVINEIRAGTPDTKIVIYSAQYGQYDADQLLANQAHMYVDKTKPLEEMLAELEALFRA